MINSVKEYRRSRKTYHKVSKALRSFEEPLLRKANDKSKVFNFPDGKIRIPAPVVIGKTKKYEGMWKELRSLIQGGKVWNLSKSELINLLNKLEKNATSYRYARREPVILD